MLVLRILLITSLVELCSKKTITHPQTRIGPYFPVRRIQNNRTRKFLTMELPAFTRRRTEEIKKLFWSRGTFAVTSARPATRNLSVSILPQIKWFLLRQQMVQFRQTKMDRLSFDLGRRGYTRKCLSSTPIRNQRRGRSSTVIPRLRNFPPRSKFQWWLLLRKPNTRLQTFRRNLWVIIIPKLP